MSLLKIDIFFTWGAKGSFFLNGIDLKMFAKMIQPLNATFSPFHHPLWNPNRRTRQRSAFGGSDLWGFLECHLPCGIHRCHEFFHWAFMTFSQLFRKKKQSRSFTTCKGLKWIFISGNPFTYTQRSYLKLYTLKILGGVSHPKSKNHQGIALCLQIFVPQLPHLLHCFRLPWFFSRRFRGIKEFHSRGSHCGRWVCMNWTYDYTPEN